MSDAVLAVVFGLAAVLSLGTSWVLASRLERVGARLGLSEALLGMVAALAADAPEITAAATALVGHKSGIGAGVVLGSNVFNLAALLGLASLLAGGIALHRRVIVMEGTVALWIAAAAVGVASGALSPALALGLVLIVLVPYLVILGVRRDRLGRLGLPQAWVRWLKVAIVEEEIELKAAIHPRRGRAADAVVLVGAVAVVVGASIAMEQAASELGARHAIPEIVVGGLILAAVTSLPNAVAAVYLARRGRGAATLSTAMNSNALNVTIGLLLPGMIIGLGASTAHATLVAAWYLGLTALALACAYGGRGLRRAHGALIICLYLAFAGVVVATAYTSRSGIYLSAAIAATIGIALAAWRLISKARPRGPLATRENSARSTRALHGPPDPSAPAGPRPNSRTPLGNGHLPIPAKHAPSPENSLITGWSIGRIWQLAIIITALIAATDALLGHHVILIGLLIAGPCCALLTGRWVRTATAGAWAIALAALLGVPDQIWGTSTHLEFLAAVAITAIVSTSSAAKIERRR